MENHGEHAVVGEALRSWLNQVQRHGIKVGLEQIREALALSGNPEASFPSALVGGTNGKGSTVAFAASILTTSGLKTGSTISPHLVSYRERFRVDGVLATLYELDKLAVALRPAIDDSATLTHFTFFELGVLLALSHFKDKGVDAALIEVGMGGEFDASRGCQPCAAALVSVDLDHQQFLGEGIDEIARTKARIAVPGGSLVVGEQRKDRLMVIREEAAQIGAELFLAGRDFKWSTAGGKFSYVSDQFRMDEISLPLGGRHQGQNAACAVALTEKFCAASGLAMPTEEQVVRGLQTTFFPGRLEMVSLGSGSSVLLDGAHNPAGARALAQALSSRPRPPRRVWLYGAMADKRRAEILEAVLPHVDEVVCTAGTTSPRFESPERLAEEVRGCPGVHRVSFSLTPGDAVGEVLDQLAPGDELLVAGSLYLVGDVRALLGLQVDAG